MPYVTTSLIWIWNLETATRKTNILFNMKQTVLLEFDPKDASDSACCRSVCCMEIDKQGKFCELCLIKAMTIWKCEITLYICNCNTPILTPLALNVYDVINRGVKLKAKAPASI